MGFAYDVSLGTFVINFRRGTGTWIQQNELDTIQFLHSGISFLNIQKVGENDYLEDSKTLSEITFYPSSERNENDNFMERSSPEPADDLIYSFLQGKLIRINCEEVSLQVTPSLA